MSQHHHTQMTEVVAHTAAEFYARESNGTSLITVTRADVSSDLKRATIFLSVLPVTAEEQALAFAKRTRTELKQFMHARGIGRPPFIEVVLDIGEKNRQAVDKLTVEKK